MSALVRQKDITINNQEDFSNYIEGLFSENNLCSYLANMKEKYALMQNKYGDDNWNIHWKKLCDGKIVFDRICNDYGKRYSMDANALKEKVFRKITNNTSTEFYSFWQKILNQYN